MNLVLHQLWEKKVKVARRFSRITKFRIAMTFALFPLNILGEIANAKSSDSGIIFVMFSITAFIIASGVFYKELAAYDQIGEWPRLKPPSTQSAKDLEAIIDPLVKAMRIECSSLQLRISFRDFGIGPSIVGQRQGDEVYVILPVGYLVLLKADLETAQSLMAHELSHVAQKDSKLWFLVTAYGKSVLRIILPFNLILGVGYIVSVGVNEGLNPVGCFLVLVVLSAPLAFYYSVTKMRRKAEFIADLGSAAFTSVYSVKRALKLTIPDKARTAFSMHPTLEERLKALDEALRYTAKPQQDLSAMEPEEIR